MNTKEKLLSLCKYYKVESVNPYDYSKEYDVLTELKCHFWDYEEMLVNDFENRTSLYPQNMGIEERFEYYINGCINKCTPSEYDPYAAYFDGVLRKKTENNALQNVSNDSAMVDILEWSIKNDIKLQNAETDPYKKGHLQRDIDRKSDELKKIKGSPQPDKIDNPATNLVLPDEVLKKLERGGYIENTTERPLKWKKTKSLLAYFVETANDTLNLKHGVKRQIKPFEILFNVTGLTSAINDYKKTGDLPIGHNDILNLF